MEEVVAGADMIMVVLMKVLMEALMEALIEALGTIDEPPAPAEVELEVGGALLDICDDEE